jgi:hypothetical protein
MSKSQLRPRGGVPGKESNVMITESSFCTELNTLSRRSSSRVANSQYYCIVGDVSCTVRINERPCTYCCIGEG